MPSGKRTYIPDFMVQELKRIKQESNLVGEKTNTIAMQLLVKEAQVGRQMKQVLNRVEKELRMERRK